MSAGRHVYSVENPELGTVHDYGDEFVLPLQGSAIDLDYYDAVDETFRRQYRVTQRQTVLELFDKLQERGEGYLDRARARAALADYLRHTVAPMYQGGPYAKLADALDNARKHGLWGVGDIFHGIDKDGCEELEPALAVKWTGRAGQVKLCPDDAREDSMRASSLYADRIAELAAEGFAVRYAVFTIPNSPAGFLRADLHTVFERLWREILYARVDGTLARSFNDPRRRFPSLRGALAVLEAPLSARGDWNVHLNVIMVFSDFPPYKELRAAWGANVEFRNVPAGAEAPALAELIKYPLQAVSFKSAEKRASGKTRAPPVIEWPADAFHEWWCAHRGFRRARSWGELYAGKLPDDERERIMPHTIEWLGKLYLSAARFYAERSMLDTTAWDERQREQRERRQPELFAPASPQIDFDELQRLQLHARFHADSELAETTAAAVRAHVDLILGNKSAEGASHTGADPPLD
jgi:hypothetical protein